MTNELMHNVLKQFIKDYSKRKTKDVKVLKVLEILLTNLESEIISIEMNCKSKIKK